jgi:uncharacterized metal-binding protein YceD (DUF177 family)
MMRGIATTSADNPDFARVVRIATLRRTPVLAFDIAPDEAEAARLARLLDARSVRRMRLAGELRPEGDGWRLDARLGATVVQTCVVTLEPVTARLDLPLRRLFVPLGTGGREIEVGPEDDDEIEPLGETLDLGLVAIEALALALPAYPRHPDADLRPAAAAPPGADPDAGSDADGTTQPFAGLAALRDRLREPK